MQADLHSFITNQHHCNDKLAWQNHLYLPRETCSKVVIVIEEVVGNNILLQHPIHLIRTFDIGTSYEIFSASSLNCYFLCILRDSALFYDPDILGAFLFVSISEIYNSLIHFANIYLCKYYSPNISIYYLQNILLSIPR